MPKDSLTGENYEFPRGVTLVKNDGVVLHFASSKNRKNYEMKRRNLRWVSSMKKSKKELAQEIMAEAAEEAKHTEEVKEAESASAVKKK
jgi:ribosomal protein L24E